MQDRDAGTIPLCAGNPYGEQPASFTRFALPFVCRLERDERTQKPSQFYDDVPIPRLAARSRYFTPETADVLFGRARWLELKGSFAYQTLRMPIGGDEIEIEIAPPRLVLFEAGARPRVELTSTAFLLVDVYFPQPAKNGEGKPSSPPTLDDLLLINELFRYWRQPFDKHPAKECTTARGVTCFTKAMANVAAAARAALDGAGRRGERLGKDDDYFDRWDWLLSYPIKDEGGYMRIASTAREAARRWTHPEDPSAALNALSDDTGWIAYTDERAFVWTCVITKSGSEDLKDALEGDPSHSGMWVRLLNVDRPSNGQATAFEKRWLRGRTYERWKHFGTLYGFNMHSGAMLASPCEEPPLWRHFSETYFDQVLLLLYLRVSTFRFSRELARISADLPFHQKRDFREFRKIRRVFAMLTNLYRFPLLSSQQQGIEMYTCARKWLDVDDLFEEVQAEIRETHEMFELSTASEMGVATGVLACIAIIIGFCGGVMALLAADDIKPYRPPREAVLRLLNHFPGLTPAWWLIVLAFGGSTALALALWRRLRK